MIEDNFKSMAIMECSDDIIKYISIEKEKIFNDYIKKGNFIYRDFKIDIYDQLNIDDVTISWVEEKQPIYNITNSNDENFIDEKSCKFKLCKLRIWKLNKWSKFIFVFFQNTSLAKSIEMLNDFTRVNFRRVILNNSFFNKLINNNPYISIVGKTISIGLSYRISMNPILNKYKEPLNEEQITEVKFIVNLLRDINVKINNKGMVRIFNKPSIEEAYEIVKIINDILNSVDSDGELYNG
ncbi:hypothetical protein ACV3P7_12785 [Clostridium perfringens]